MSDKYYNSNRDSNRDIKQDSSTVYVCLTL